MRWYRTSKGVQGVLLVLLGIFSAAPVVWIFVNSLESGVTYSVENILIFLKRYLSLEQYDKIMFHDLEYWAAYCNTLLLTAPILVIAVGITSTAAYGLTIIQKNLREKMLLVYVILSLLPMQVLLVPQLIMLSKLQLTGTRIAVILVASFSPWYVFFLHRLCRGIPEETFEMARVEGAGEWKIFWKIALPQMRFGIMIFSIIIIADLWGMVEEPLVYIQDISKYPLSVLFHETGTEISYAGIVLFAVPVVALFLKGIRNVMEGEER